MVCGKLDESCIRRDGARSAPAAGRRNTGALARAIATDIAPTTGTRLAARQRAEASWSIDFHIDDTSDSRVFSRGGATRRGFEALWKCSEEAYVERIGAMRLRGRWVIFTFSLRITSTTLKYGMPVPELRTNIDKQVPPGAGRRVIDSVLER